MRDYLERERRKKKISYNRRAVILRIKDEIDFIEQTCDGCGDVDWALASLQIYFHRLERILDENGSL